MLKSILCFMMPIVTHSYVTYVESRFKITSISDSIPSWAYKCYDIDIYSGKMCNDDCNIALYSCIYADCSSDEIHDAQHKAISQGSDALLINGKYSSNDTCHLPISFVGPDINNHVGRKIYITTYPFEHSLMYIISGYVSQIVFTAFVLFCFVCIILKKQRVYNRTVIVEHRIRPSTIQETMVDIPGDDISMKDELEGETCSICIDEFDLRHQIYKLECGHVFHKECILRWMNTETRCPLCNKTYGSISEDI